MLGTLNGALEVRGVKAASIRAEVEGENEIRDGIPVLARVRIHYTIRVPAGTGEAVDRALARHQDKCPTAATLKPAVDIGWSADVSFED